MKKLTFVEGLIIGFLMSVFILSTLIETFYVSHDTLRLGSFYMDRKFYKRCEVR